MEKEGVLGGTALARTDMAISFDIGLPNYLSSMQGLASITTLPTKKCRGWKRRVAVNKREAVVAS